MSLSVEVEERRSEASGVLHGENKFSINPSDLREVFDRFGNPSDWTHPIVILHEPETRVVQVEQVDPKPTRKPYEFPFGYVVPSDVAAGKLSKRGWRVNAPPESFWNDTDSSTADTGDLVRVRRQLKEEILLATVDEIDPILDGTVAFLEPYNGSYLDRGDMPQPEETTAVITFCEEAPYGVSQVSSERKSELSAIYNAVPLAPERVYFQGVIHFKKDGGPTVFELVDKNIVTGKSGLVDQGKQLNDARRFFTEPHPTHPDATPFMRLARKGKRQR